MIRLTLSRLYEYDQATIGTLTDGDNFLCWTLEDVSREVKVYGATCIPAGTYKIILNKSQRFNKILPRLLNVPNFTGILIHSGNGPENTSGCILIGDELDATASRIKGGTSSPAMARLMALLEGQTDIEITIQ